PAVEWPDATPASTIFDGRNNGERQLITDPRITAVQHRPAVRRRETIRIRQDDNSRENVQNLRGQLGPPSQASCRRLKASDTSSALLYWIFGDTCCSATAFLCG